MAYMDKYSSEDAEYFYDMINGKYHDTPITKQKSKGQVNFYAIVNCKTSLYFVCEGTWDDVQELIIGESVKQKKFKTEKEAKDWAYQTHLEIKKSFTIKKKKYGS